MENKRIKKLIENMNKNNINQLVISSPSAILYLTGKMVSPGERLLALYINSDGKIVFFVNELFAITESQFPLCIYNDSEDPIEKLADVVKEGQTLGIDKEWPARFLISLMNKKPSLKFVNGSFIVDEVRMIKDEEEIKLMRNASKINDKVMEEIISMIDAEKSEMDMCRIIGDLYAKYDTYEFSFYPLVSYGANAAEPHHDSDKSLPKEGKCILFDIGGRTNYYCSDMTRTVFYKNISEKDKEIYKIVLESNLKGIEKVKPGVKLSDIDKVSRAVIEKAGYGKYFTHRTGHNIGIEDHEYPDVGANCDIIAKPGMIFSIEPGIYLPGSTGVRIEDIVLVTENGCEVLNNYTKEIQIR